MSVIALDFRHVRPEDMQPFVLLVEDLANRGGGLAYNVKQRANNNKSTIRLT